MSLPLVIRLALRDWRAGELRLLLTSILIAVGTVTAISFFIDRLHQALVSESTTFLAADRVISGGQPIPEAFEVSQEKTTYQSWKRWSFHPWFLHQQSPKETN